MCKRYQRCAWTVLRSAGGILAYGRKIRWVEKIFEYDSQFGCEVSSIYGFTKAKFNSEDFAVITCDTRVELD